MLLVSFGDDSANDRLYVRSKDSVDKVELVPLQSSTNLMEDFNSYKLLLLRQLFIHNQILFLHSMVHFVLHFDFFA